MNKITAQFIQLLNQTGHTGRLQYMVTLIQKGTFPVQSSWFERLIGADSINTEQILQDLEKESSVSYRALALFGRALQQNRKAILRGLQDSSIIVRGIAVRSAVLPCISDQDLVSIVLELPPIIRSGLVRNIVRANRRTVAEQLLPKLIALEYHREYRQLLPICQS